MISILIPIYNFDVRAFVHSLSDQLITNNIEGEIICLDDGSNQEYLDLNAEIEAIPRVHYLKSHKNLGRSGVRNALLELSKYELLLFLDCDGKVNDSKYLKNYLNYPETDVIYGGRSYAQSPPVDAQYYFHWLCGKSKEEVPAQQRALQPYKAFMTNNFLIKKSVFKAVGMDERVRGYGHEDTLFAANLKRAGYEVAHIDNPIEHIGIEATSVFLDKSVNAVFNLAQLIKQGAVGRGIPLVKYYYVLRNFGIAWFFGALVSFFQNMIKWNLRSSYPSLVLFDLWKLGLLCKAMK